MEEEVKSEEDKEELVHPLEKSTKIISSKSTIILGAILVIFAGIGTGFFLSRSQSEFAGGGKTKMIKTQKMAGSTDTKAFPDQAEGILEKGGIDGEGTHKLIRDPKNPAQTAYLTSSVVNLDDFVGKKVRIWGQTFAAQKAGWLIDVGRVEVME